MDASAAGLVSDLFAPVADPELWVSIPGAENAFVELFDCLSTGRGIAILTAPAGLGKTLICLRLQRELSSSCRVIFFPGGGLETPTSFLQNVLCELEQPYRNRTRHELRLKLRRALRSAGTSASGLCLLIDEADALSDDVLEEIRATTNVTEYGRPMVRVLLSGQFPLEEKLTSPRLDALNQRIGCHVHLEPFTRQESTDYIRTRVRSAGDELQHVFDLQAVQTIVAAAAGNPRCLNQLCGRALILADRTKGRPVDDATARRALEELKHLPLLWADPPPALETTSTPANVPLNDPVADELEPSADAVFDGAASEEQSGTAVFEVGHNSETVSSRQAASPTSDCATSSESGTVCDAEAATCTDQGSVRPPTTLESTELTASASDPSPLHTEREPESEAIESESVPTAGTLTVSDDFDTSVAAENDSLPGTESSTATDDISGPDWDRVEMHEPPEVVADISGYASEETDRLDIPELSESEEDPIEADEPIDAGIGASFEAGFDDSDDGHVESVATGSVTAETGETDSPSPESLIEDDDAEDEEEFGWLFGAAESTKQPVEEDLADETEASGIEENWQDVEPANTNAGQVDAVTLDRDMTSEAEAVDSAEAAKPWKADENQTDKQPALVDDNPVASQPSDGDDSTDLASDDDWSIQIQESDAGWESVPTQTPLSRDDVQDGPEVKFGVQNENHAMSDALPAWESGESVIEPPSTPREESVEDYYADLRALESLNATSAQSRSPQAEPDDLSLQKTSSDRTADSRPSENDPVPARSAMWDDRPVKRPEPSLDSAGQSTSSFDSDDEVSQPAPDDMIDSVMAAVEQAAADDEFDHEDTSEWQARLLSQLVEMSPEDAIDSERFDVVQPENSSPSDIAMGQPPADSLPGPTAGYSDAQESLRKQADLFSRLRKLRDQF